MNLGRESETVEFKESMAQLDKGILGLTAMLNRRNHGTLYIGVDDDGDVIGMEVGESTAETIRDRIRSKVKPQVVPEIEIHNGRRQEVRLRQRDGIRYPLLLRRPLLHQEHVL